MAQNYKALLEEILATTGMSQVALAKHLGITLAALSRWIKGHSEPRPRHGQLIERVYRELVAYPSFKPKVIQRIVTHAARERHPGIWKKIARHSALQEDLILEHTYNSTTIEGTTFTRHETEVVIFSKKILPDKSLQEHLEVTNHAAVLQKILRGEYDRSVTEILVKDIHQGLLQGIRSDAGQYSRHHRAIRGVHVALTHPEDIPEEMENLIRRWKKYSRKTIREIAVFHSEFELIHPFGDGNGRVGRLLMAIQCLQQDYPPLIVENARKAEYYDVLEYSQRKTEGPLIAFLADELKTTAKLFRKHRI